MANEFPLGDLCFSNPICWSGNLSVDFNVVRYIVRDMRMRYVCHCACEELQKLLSSVVLETSNHPEAESDSQRVCHESDARHSIAEKMDMNGYWMKWQEEAKYIEMMSESTLSAWSHSIHLPRGGVWGGTHSGAVVICSIVLHHRALYLNT